MISLCISHTIFFPHANSDIGLTVAVLDCWYWLCFEWFQTESLTVSFIIMMLLPTSQLITLVLWQQAEDRCVSVMTYNLLRFNNVLIGKAECTYILLYISLSFYRFLTQINKSKAFSLGGLVIHCLTSQGVDLDSLTVDLVLSSPLIISDVQAVDTRYYYCMGELTRSGVLCWP